MHQLLPAMHLGALKLAARDLARDVNEEAYMRRVLARLGLSQDEPRYDIETELLAPDWFPADR